MTDDRPTKEAFDALLRQHVELHEQNALLSNRMARFESCPFLMEHVLAFESQTAGKELAIIADVQRQAQRDARDAELVEAITERPWVGVFVAADQPRGVVRVSIPLGAELGTREGAIGSRIHVELASDWAARVAANKPIAELIAAGEIEVRQLAMPEAIAAERNRRASESVAAAPRAPINHFARRRSAP